ncbi:MAG TPA: hypothetical protein VG347_24590, partial [Verrucomicrobiae bacterium]|nr:hypothetical protein [Verrucomicrobiae bacterium]
MSNQATGWHMTTHQHKPHKPQEKKTTMAQAYIRSDISKSKGDFSNQNIVWYAVGVNKMMQRTLDDPASWWYFGAIHGDALQPKNI